MKWSRVEPLVPPDRGRQLMGDLGGIGMRGVDKNVSVQSRRYRRNDQDRRPRLFDPRRAKPFANRFALAVPTRMLGGVKDFIAGVIWNRDADIMLTFGNYRTGMNQLFEHRGRVIFGRIDKRAGGSIPSPRIEARALAVVNRMCALGITDTKTG